MARGECVLLGHHACDGDCRLWNAGESGRPGESVKVVDAAQVRERVEEALAGHRQEFETFFLARLLELSFEYEGDLCRIRFPASEFLFNPQGSLHGGIIATVMDISMGHLIKWRTGKAGTTLETKLQYLRPISSGVVVCEGRFLRQGRGISFMESKLWDESGNLAAFASSTWRVSQG